MPYEISPGLLNGVRIFLESTDDLEGLWKGMHRMAWDYLQNNIDEGVDEEINGKFLGDFNNLMELIWLLHELAQKEKE